MNHWYCNKFIMVFLMSGLVIVLTAGAVFAGSGEQRAKIELFPTLLALGATGEAELQIREGEFEFKAKVEDLPSGLGDVSFCLGTLLIDTENVEDDGRVELNEDEADGDPIEAVPTSISGRVTIRAGSDCTGTILLQGTVS